jgi:hypothetical protein
LGRGAFAAGFIALGCITPSIPGAHGAPERSVEFQGELNYEAFKRASDKGVAIRITQSPGGTGAAAMVLGRAKGLVIDGPCNSACAWAFVQNESACFTQRASFGFHAAHDPGTGRRLTAATDYWLGTVGPALRSRLAGLRASSSVIRVGAKEMSRYYGGRLCGANGQRADAADAAPQTGTATAGAKVASADQSQKGEDGAQTATAGAARRQFWSNADDEAAVEALLVAQESAGVTVAAHVQASAETSSETLLSAGSATGLIGELVPSLAPEAATRDIASSPLPACILWGGVTISTIGRETELAARREMPSSDG